MIVKLKILDIKPRTDKLYIIAKLIDFLDKCDPDDRPDLTIQFPS